MNGKLGKLVLKVSWMRLDPVKKDLLGIRVDKVTIAALEGLVIFKSIQGIHGVKVIEQALVGV